MVTKQLICNLNLYRPGFFLKDPRPITKNVIINKRSMSAGYAGINNELFYNDKTKMLFGDAKGVLQKLVAEVKAA